MCRRKWFGGKILLAHIQQPTLERVCEEEKIIFKTGIGSEYVMSAAIFCTFSVHYSCWDLHRVRVLSVGGHCQIYRAGGEPCQVTETAWTPPKWREKYKWPMLKTQEGERQKLRNNKPKCTCLKTSQMDLRNVVCWLASVPHLHVL